MFLVEYSTFLAIWNVSVSNKLREGILDRIAQKNQTEILRNCTYHISLDETNHNLSRTHNDLAEKGNNKLGSPFYYISFNFRSIIADLNVSEYNYKRDLLLAILKMVAPIGIDEEFDFLMSKYANCRFSEEISFGYPGFFGLM